jgi:hypothetical protein
VRESRYTDARNFRCRIAWSVSFGSASVRKDVGKVTDGSVGVRKGGGTSVECGQSVVKGVGKVLESPGYADWIKKSSSSEVYLSIGKF